MKIWARHVARMGQFWLVNQKGRNNSEDLGVDGKIILEYI